MSELSGIRPRSRDTVILTARQRGERRGQLRSQPVGEYRTTFSHGGLPQAATLRDVSKGGAGFRVPQPGALSLEVGTVLEVSIQTPWETVQRKGRVTWSKAVNGELFFGVAYVELPADADCVGLLNMDKVKIDPALALRLSAQLALRRQVLPFAVAEGQVHVACLNPRDTTALQAVEKCFSCPVRAEAAEPEALQRALDRVYGDASAGSGAPARARSVDLRSLGELTPDEVVSLCDELLAAALLRQASDIHIDPHAAGVQVRFRVDGALELYRQFPASF